MTADSVKIAANVGNAAIGHHFGSEIIGAAHGRHMHGFRRALLPTKTVTPLCKLASPTFRIFTTPWGTADDSDDDESLLAGCSV